MRWWVPLLLVGIALVVFIASGPQDPAARDAETDRDESPTHQDAPALSGRDGTDAGVSADAGSSERDATPSLDEAIRHGGGRMPERAVLTVHVEGLPPAASAHARLTLQSLNSDRYEPEQRTLPPLDDQGQTRLEGKALLDLLLAYRGATLEFSHPHYLAPPVYLRPEDRHIDGDGVLRMKATLSARHGTWLEGRVLLPGGGPAVDADVVLVHFDEEGVPHRHGKTSCDASGRWRIAVKPIGENRLHVVARERTTLPSWTRTPVHAREITQVPDLTLRQAREVTGRLQVNGVPSAGVLHVSPVDEDARRVRVGQNLDWDGTSFRPGSRLARADDEGAFRIGGLDETPIALRGSPWSLVGDAPSSPGVSVFPTAHDVVVDVRVATLTITSSLEGAPAEGVDFAVRAGGETMAFSVGRSPPTGTRIHVIPGQRVALSASAAGAAPWKQTLDIPADAVDVPVHIDFAPDQALTGRIEIRARPVAEVPPFLTVELVPAAGQEGKTWEVELDASETGWFIFDRAPVGHWRAHLTPGRAWQTGVMHLARTVDLETKEGQTTLKEVAFVRGGRLTVSIRNPDGQPTDCKMRLASPLDREEDDDPLPTLTGLIDRAVGVIRKTGGVLAAPLIHVHPPLPRGPWVLLLEKEDHLPARIEFAIHVGKTTHIEHTFVPKR